jgi:hypothetical protein
MRTTGEKWDIYCRQTRNHVVRSRANWQLDHRSKLKQALRGANARKQQEAERDEIRRQFREGVFDPRSTRHLQAGPPDQVRQKYLAKNEVSTRRIRNAQENMQAQRQVVAELRTKMENVDGEVPKLYRQGRKSLATHVGAFVRGVTERTAKKYERPSLVANDLSPHDVRHEERRGKVRKYIENQ